MYIDPNAPVDPKAKKDPKAAAGGEEAVTVVTP